MGATEFHAYVREKQPEYFLPLSKYAAYLLESRRSDEAIHALINETIIAALEYYPDHIITNKLWRMKKIMRNILYMARDKRRIKSMIDGIQHERFVVGLVSEDYLNISSYASQYNYVYAMEMLRYVSDLGIEQEKCMHLAILGFTPKEIAIELEVPWKSAERKLHQARKKIKKNSAYDPPIPPRKTHYIGVSHASANCWQAKARITKDGVREYFHLGSFRTEAGAARAYDQWALEHRGSDAVLNFPTPLRRTPGHA